jgi:MFS family permease
MRTVLRIADFRLLFAGLAASMVGDALMMLVYAIWIKRLTGSNAAAGSVTFFMAIPFVLAPLSGWLVDRFRHRPFLIVVNIASALTLLPLTQVHDASDIWIIYTVAGLYGVSAVAIAAALNGLLKELLDDELLADANGTLQTVKEGLRLGGPLVGAALFATLGGAAVAEVDAITFLIAALAIARMRLREDRPVRSRRRGEVTAGLRHIRTDPALRRVTLGMAIAFLFIGINESVIFAIVDQGLHRPPEFVGVLASAQGIGAIAGGLVAARVIARTGELTTIAIGMTAFGIGDGLYALPWLTVILGARIVSGCGLAAIVVGFTTIIQRRTPGPLIGRVSSATETLITGPQMLSIAVGAVLISVVDYRVLLLVVMTGMLIAAASLWPARRLTGPTRGTPAARVRSGENLRPGLGRSRRFRPRRPPARPGP